MLPCASSLFVQIRWWRGQFLYRRTCMCNVTGLTVSLYVFVAWMWKPHYWFVPALCKEFWTILVTTSLNRCMHGVMAGQAWKVRHFRLPQDSAGRPTHGLQESSKLVQTLCIHITLSVLGFLWFSRLVVLYFSMWAGVMFMILTCNVHFGRAFVKGWRLCRGRGKPHDEGANIQPK